MSKDGLCPKCGSDNAHRVHITENGEPTGETWWNCDDCDHGWEDEPDPRDDAIAALTRELTALRAAVHCVATTEATIEALAQRARDGGDADLIAITERLAALTRERDELQALQDEQEAILAAVGPITCSNGRKHDHLRGCLYCDRDREKARADAAEREVQRLRGLLGEARTCASAHERLPDIVPSATICAPASTPRCAPRGGEGEE